MTHWQARRWIAAILAATTVAVLVGVPTGIIRTPFYTRMTPVLWWNYPISALTAVLGGLIFATYVRPTATPTNRQTTTSLGGTVLSALAVGCPICNKVVIAAVGVSGALNLWAPSQPVLGVVSLMLLVWSLHRRLSGERSCSTQLLARDPDISVYDVDEVNR